MAVIAAQTATGTSNLASTLVTWNNNTTTGNTIVVVIGNSSTSSGDVSSVTDSQGNVYSKVFTTDNASVGDLEVWYSAGIIGGSTPTITVAYTTGVACAVIAREYWGLYIPSQNPFDQQNSATGNSTSPSSGNVQLKQPIELLIGACLTPINTTYTLGSGYGNLTSLNSSVLVSAAMEDQYVTSIGPWSATFGVGAVTLQWVCGIATFYQAPAGTTTSTSFTTSTSISSTSTSSTSSSISSTSVSTSTSSTSTSLSSTSTSISSTSSSISSTSISSTSSSTSISSTSTSISSTSTSSTSTSSVSTSTSISSTSSSLSSTSSSISSTSFSTSSTSVSSTSSSSSTSTTTLPPPYLDYSYSDLASSLTLRQLVTGGNANGIATVVSSVFSTPASVILVAFAACGTFTPSNTCTVSGAGLTWSLAKRTNTQNGSAEVWTAQSSAPLQNVTVSCSTAAGNDAYLAVAVFTGADMSGTNGSAAIGATGTNNGTANDITAMVTTTRANSWVWGVASDLSGGSGVDIPKAIRNNVISYQFEDTAFLVTFIVLSQALPTSASSTSITSAATSTLSGASMKYNFSVVEILPALPPDSTSQDLSNLFTAHQYSNASVDDGDYFVQTGSKYIITEFKRQSPNNSNNIQVIWKGRTTLAPSRSRVFLQIFNQNSSAWETLGSQSVVSVDTDFILQGTQNTNVANYYDSTNTVSCRVYQLVV